MWIALTYVSQLQYPFIEFCGHGLRVGMKVGACTTNVMCCLGNRLY